MRGAVPDRWLRVHGLPTARRYAAHDGESEEIARRQVAAAAALFDDGAPTWVVTWVHGAEACVNGTLASIGRATGLPLEHAGVLAHDVDDEAFTLLVAPVPWGVESSAALRRAIADDRERAMWVHAETGEVFAPYDGGVDLIFANAPRREAYRHRFAAWL